MARCTYCGVENDSLAGPCILCGHRLSSSALISDAAIRRVGLTVLVPLLVWLCATRGLHLF
jgi:hypothetical protein